MKNQIQQIQKRLAYALAEADKAKAQAIVTETAYDQEFDKMVAEFETTHPDLVEARNSAKAIQARIDEEVQTIRREAQDMLSEYFLQPDAESKPAPGFSMRQEKKATYDSERLLNQAIEKRAIFLLQLDVKAVQKFVVALAEKDVNDYVWPEYLRGWLTELRIETVNKPLISDKALIADAPDVAPLPF